MRALRWSLAVALIACFAVFQIYRAKDPERRTLDEAARTEAPGRLVRLADGVTDPVAPLEDSEALLAAMPRAMFVPVDSAAHLPHLEQTGVVVPAVVRFLRGEPQAQR